MRSLFLLALTACLISNAKAQNVGIGTNTPAASAQLEVNSTTKGFLPPRMSSAQRNAIASPATGLTIYNTTYNGLQTYNGTNWYSTVHYTGESFGGGIVFYVYDNGQHGLIAFQADIGTSTWSSGVSISTLAQGGGTNACFNCTPASGLGGIGGGNRNTTIILSKQSGASGAAYACANFSVSYFINGGTITYEDWYLPSIDELNLMYSQKALIGGFLPDAYWSSTEISITNAWWQTFFDGLQSSAAKTNTYNIRPIRSF